MKKALFILGSVISVILVLVLVNVFVSNTLSTKGLTLSKLDDKIKLYKKENSVLKEQYLSLSSFQNIASKAAERGFVKQKSVVYLNTPLPLALR